MLAQMAIKLDSMPIHEVYTLLRNLRRTCPECYLEFAKRVRLFPVGKGLDKKV